MKLPKIFGAMTVAAILFATSAGVSAAPDYTEGVNWTQKVITVTGEGLSSPDAINETQAKGLASKAARADAYRKLAEVINGVQVDSETTVEKMLTTRDVIKTRVSATIKGAQVIDETFSSDGTCRVVMQIPIFGAKDSLAGAVLERSGAIEPFPEPDYEIDPSVQPYDPTTPVNRRIEVVSHGTKVVIEEPAPSVWQKIDPSKPPLSRLSAGKFDFDNMKPLITGEAWSTTAAESYEKQIDRKVRKTVSEYSSMAKGDYTGLVIDCRGMKLQPVMSPVVKNSNGTKIYGHKNLDIDKIIEMGMADYTSNMESMERAGDNPLVIKATAVENFNSNPVLEIPDSNRVLIENHVTKFLADLKVVFLFDE